MTTNGNNKWFSISSIARIFGSKPLVIRVIDNITNANNKVKMMMAMFELHRKYFEEVDFDTLFLELLEPLIIYPPEEGFISYFDIAGEIISDDVIPDYKIKSTLLNWIYNEPFFRTMIIAETPRAEVELHPPIVDVNVVPLNALDM